MVKREKTCTATGPEGTDLGESQAGKCFPNRKFRGSGDSIDPRFGNFAYGVVVSPRGRGTANFGILPQAGIHAGVLAMLAVATRLQAVGERVAPRVPAREARGLRSLRSRCRLAWLA